MPHIRFVWGTFGSFAQGYRRLYLQSYSCRELDFALPFQKGWPTGLRLTFSERMVRDEIGEADLPAGVEGRPARGFGTTNACVGAASGSTANPTLDSLLSGSASDVDVDCPCMRGQRNLVYAGLACHTSHDSFTAPPGLNEAVDNVDFSANISSARDCVTPPVEPSIDTFSVDHLWLGERFRWYGWTGRRSPTSWAPWFVHVL